MKSCLKGRSNTAINIRINSPKITQVNNQCDLKKKEYKPSEIHELKLKTLKLEQENKILKTQLNRLADRIKQQTQIINKTTKYSGPNNKQQNHSVAIEQLSRSVVSAKNTLNTLNGKLKAVDYDDRNAIVDELHEELKVTYSEYMRVQDMVKSKGSEVKNIDRVLMNATKKASEKNIHDMEIQLMQLKETNHDIRNKISAYMIKSEKSKFEDAIERRENDKQSLECCMQELKETIDRRVSKSNELSKRLKKQKYDYKRKVHELNQILISLRSKLFKRLTGEEMPHCELEDFLEEEDHESSVGIQENKELEEDETIIGDDDDADNNVEEGCTEYPQEIDEPSEA